MVARLLSLITSFYLYHCLIQSLLSVNIQPRKPRLPKMDLKGTFHRRELKDPAVSFSSFYGRQLFAESLSQGSMESYFPLSEQFITQGHPSFCGIGSLTMALNALMLDPQRVWQGVWRWFDESMLDCCDSHDTIKLKGLTLPKVACLARCNGASTAMKYGSDATEQEFRADISRICRQTIDDKNRQILIVSYARPVLNQSGSGHFSPIGGYHEASDMVLIMDVARFKYPPHWVPLSMLFQALQPIDPETNRSRGYVMISRGEDSSWEACCVCSDAHSSTETNTTDGANDNPTPADGSDQASVVHSRIESIINHKCSHCL